MSATAQEVKQSTLDDSQNIMYDAVVATESSMNDIQAILGIVPDGATPKALEEPTSTISGRIYRSQALGDRVRDINAALFDIVAELRRL